MNVSISEKSEEQLQSSSVGFMKKVVESRDKSISKSFPSESLMSYISSNSCKAFQRNPPRCPCKPRVLIVDDSQFNLFPLKHMIKRVQMDFDIVDDYKKNHNSALVASVAISIEKKVQL